MESLMELLLDVMDDPEETAHVSADEAEEALAARCSCL